MFPLEPHISTRRNLLAAGGLGAAAVFAAAPSASAETSGGGSWREDPTDANVIHVLGARGDADANFATNNKAFAETWQEVLRRQREESRGGQTVRVPPGVYLIDHWDLSVVWSDIGSASEPEAQRSGSESWFVNVTIQAEGVVFVAKKSAGETYQSVSGPAPVPEPVIRVGSREGGRAQNLLKKVTIIGLRIQAGTSPSANLNSIQRLGILIEHCQQFVMDRVWISLLTLGGMSLVGTMDCAFSNVQILWCGRDSEDTSAKRYGLTITGSAESARADNPNALRLTGIHIEFCPLLLLIDSEARHVDFFACKFEQSAPSRTSPVVLGGVDGTGGRGSVLEIGFHGSMFVGSYYNNKSNPNPHVFKTQQPPFVSVEERSYYGEDSSPQRNVFASDSAWRTHTAVSFTGCHFTTPNGAGARWFRGANSSFTACDFSGCANVGDEAPSIDMGDNVIIEGGRFALTSSIDDKFGNGRASTITAAEGLRNDLFRFRGSSASVSRPIVFSPPPAADGQRVPGALLTLAGGDRTRRNMFTGYRPVYGQAPTPTRYENSAEKHLNDRLEVDSIFVDIATQLTGSQGSPPSVFGRSAGTLMSGVYEDFLDAYAGQHLRLVVGWGQQVDLINSDSLILQGRRNRTVPEKTWLSFDRVGTSWIEF